MRFSKAIRSLAALTAGAAMAAGAGCGLPDSEYFGHVPDDPDPKHLRWCNSGEPEYVDPALVTDTTGMKLTYGMFDGLTDHNMQGLPEPSIATRWDIEDNQRRFVFHLHDKARWSNGRPIDAYDFAYHIARVLHPSTVSRNAGDPLWKIKNAELYTANRVKKVLRDVGGFRAGDIVEIIGLDGTALTDKSAIRALTIPNSNLRTSDKPLRLRDMGAAEGEAYASVPAGAEVTFIELHPQDASWAYVYWADANEGSGVYGWVPAAELTGQPNADVVYTVKRVPRSSLPGVAMSEEELLAEIERLDQEDKRLKERAATAKEEGRTLEPEKGATLTGRDLLMTPEVLGVIVEDRYTLVLETFGPTPYMIDVTPSRGFRASPREAVSRQPVKWTEPERIVTSGAFHMTEWKQRDYIRLKKSPTYWRANEVQIDTLTSYNMNDQAASANYYYAGNCDAITSNNIPSSYFPVLNGAKRDGKKYEDYTPAPYLGIYFFLINTQKLDNVHLRRALNHAIDRRPIPQILNGGQIPTGQYSPGTPISQLSPEDRALCGVKEGQEGVAMVMISGELCYVPPPGFEFDPARAKQDLERARKELGNKFPKRLSLKFNSGVEGHKLIAEYVQDQWQRNLGITVMLEVQEWKTFLKDTANGEYDVARMGWIGSFPDSEAQFLPNFRCDNPDNRTKFCNDDFERIMRQAEATFDRQERVKLVQEAEAIIIDQAPVIPLYVYTQHHLQKPYVRDLSINFMDQVPLRKAWIDPNWKQSKAKGN